MSTETILTQVFKTPVGELILGSYNDQLCLCDWRYRKMRATIDKRIQEGLQAGFEEGDSPILNAAKQQLTGYFDGQRTAFDIPLRFVGTDFQKKVWEALMHIPFGKTEKYLGLARKLGNEKTIRAVAAANGANALAIIVPCHRVVGSDGELVGYAGGINAKKKLLQLEGSIHASEQLQLFEAAPR